VLARSSRVDERRAAVTVTRFSALGAWVVLALAVTGLLLGWRIVGSVDALLSTSYGQALLVKVAVALCVVAVAAWNRYRLVPAFAARSRGQGAGLGAVRGDATVARRLGRTVVIEAGLLVVVLAVTGVLVSRSPVDGAAAAPASVDARPTVVEETRPLGDGTLELRVTPGAVGVNALEIVLLDADGAPLEPVEDPVVTTTLAEPALGPFAHVLVGTAPGAYEAPLDLPLAGSWTITVNVRTSKFESPIVEIPLEVAS